METEQGVPAPETPRAEPDASMPENGLNSDPSKNKILFSTFNNGLNVLKLTEESEDNLSPM